MAGTPEDFQSTISSLNRVLSDYKSELAAVEEMSAVLEQTQEQLSAYTAELNDVSARLNLLPHYGANLEAVVKCYWELVEQTKLKARNVDFESDRPRFITGVDPRDKSITMEFELEMPESPSVSSPRPLQIILHLDSDSRIDRIQVFDSLLGRAADLSSEMSEAISEAITLQNFGHFLRRLKSRLACS